MILDKITKYQITFEVSFYFVKCDITELEIIFQPHCNYAVQTEESLLSPAGGGSVSD